MPQMSMIQEKYAKKILDLLGEEKLMALEKKLQQMNR